MDKKRQEKLLASTINLNEQIKKIEDNAQDRKNGQIGSFVEGQEFFENEGMLLPSKQTYAEKFQQASITISDNLEKIDDQKNKEIVNAIARVTDAYKDSSSEDRELGIVIREVALASINEQDKALAIKHSLKTKLSRLIPIVSTLDIGAITLYIMNKKEPYLTLNDALAALGLVLATYASFNLSADIEIAKSIKRNEEYTYHLKQYGLYKYVLDYIENIKQKDKKKEKVKQKVIKR